MNRRRPCTSASVAVWLVTAVLAVLPAPSTAAPTAATTAATTADIAPVAHQARMAVPMAAPACDPRASLRPAGLPPPGQMPAGSSMEAIARRGFLIAGADQNTFLFGYQDPRTRRVEGFEADLARAVAKAIFGDPERVEFRPVNVADRIRMVESGAVDLVVNTLTITCDRKAQVEFSAVYYETGQRILVNQGSPVATLADLRGKRVCAARGSTSLQRVLASPERPVPVGVPNAVDCLVALQRGEVDAVSTDDTLLAGMAAQDPRAQIVGPRFTDEPYGIAVSKANQDLVRFVNGVLARWIADGSWTASYNRWLAVLGPPPAPPTPSYRD
ncbi:glutamate ABC transporter substrate-binding protein [Pseudonocardia acaciae]|uniref:glutamate ABC transporter substrate-binding protein n=1 Tax=Pseudonocardia acaciae TaxID=551276 RepID=UPI0005607A06|nr:glutamate ABC transporter substrate-binding protein [Pseudonocardia acaciae]